MTVIATEGCGRFADRRYADDVRRFDDTYNCIKTAFHDTDILADILARSPCRAANDGRRPIWIDDDKSGRALMIRPRLRLRPSLQVYLALTRIEAANAGGRDATDRKTMSRPRPPPPRPPPPRSCGTDGEGGS